MKNKMLLLLLGMAFACSGLVGQVDAKTITKMVKKSEIAKAGSLDAIKQKIKEDYIANKKTYNLVIECAVVKSKGTTIAGGAIPIPNATVSYSGLKSGTAKTDATGKIVIPNVPEPTPGQSYKAKITDSIVGTSEENPVTTSLATGGKAVTLTIYISVLDDDQEVSIEVED